jgi:hypothetical protein
MSSAAKKEKQKLKFMSSEYNRIFDIEKQMLNLNLQSKHSLCSKEQVKLQIWQTK